MYKKGAAKSGGICLFVGKYVHVNHLSKVVPFFLLKSGVYTYLH